LLSPFLKRKLLLAFSVAWRKAAGGGRQKELVDGVFDVEWERLSGEESRQSDLMKMTLS
jgi:hypothetical protein